MRRTMFVIGLVIVLVAGVVPFHAVMAQDDPGVPEARFARLARGTNLPFWFWLGPRYDALLRIHYTDADFATIRGLGFTHVRLPIGLEFVMDPEADDLLRHDRLAFIDMALDRALAADLAVIVEIHSTSIEAAEAADYTADLEDPAFAEMFIAFWESFGAYLSARDPEMVFIEPVNEPVFLGHTQDWLPLQERLVAAIRAVAPEHTLIASGAEWSHVDQLVKLEPLDDPNIVYNFHFYEPFVFTHQGATWSWWAVAPMRAVPYPSSPEAIEEALRLTFDDDAKPYIVNYGDERWDIDTLDEWISRAVTWADDHGGLRLYCGEFGVHKPYAPPEDRAQWHHDVVTVFERYDIGWAMWDYDSNFGLVERSGGETIIDKALVEAMGLNPGGA